MHRPDKRTGAAAHHAKPDPARNRSLTYLHHASHLPWPNGGSSPVSHDTCLGVRARLCLFSASTGQPRQRSLVPSRMQDGCPNRSRRARRRRLPRAVRRPADAGFPHPPGQRCPSAKPAATASVRGLKATRVTGTLAPPRQFQRRLAHRAAAEEGPEHDGIGARRGEPAPGAREGNRFRLGRVAAHAHVLAVRKAPAVQRILLHRGDDGFAIRAGAPTPMWLPFHSSRRGASVLAATNQTLAPL